MLAIEEPATTAARRTFKFLPANEPQMAQQLSDAVAFRTNQLQRANGRDPESRLQDFLAARAEIYCRLYGGVFDAEGRFDLVADISCFEMGSVIKVYLEPRRVILFGKASAEHHGLEERKQQANLGGNTIFRFLDLQDEIDPSQARAEIDGCVLEIHLPKSNSGCRAA